MFFLFSATVKHFQAKISIWQLLLIFQNSQMFFYLFPSSSAALKLNKELPWHPLFFFFFLSSLRFHQEHGEAELWQRAHVQADCDRLWLWKKPRLWGCSSQDQRQAHLQTQLARYQSSPLLAVARQPAPYRCASVLNKSGPPTHSTHRLPLWNKVI